MRTSNVAYAILAAIIAVIVLFAFAPIAESAANAFATVETAFHLANGKLAPDQQH